MKFTHNEYSFSLHTRRLGTRVSHGTNPFTGADIDFPVDDGLSDTEQIEVQAIFDRYGVIGPEPDFEGYVFHLPADSTVRFRGGVLLDDGSPLTGFSVEMVVKHLSDEALNFVLDVARGGNFALMTSTGKAVRLLTPPTNAKTRTRWPRTHVINTTNDLKKWLETEVRARNVFRSPKSAKK